MFQTMWQQSQELRKQKGPEVRVSQTITYNSIDDLEKVSAGMTFAISPQLFK